jgi:hypothetical protein
MAEDSSLEARPQPAANKRKAATLTGKKNFKIGIIYTHGAITTQALKK